MSIPLTKDGKPDKRYDPFLPVVIKPESQELSDLPKLDKFVYYKYQGLSTYHAAKAAGYSESYSKTKAYQLLRKQSYQEKSKEYYKAEAINTLPKQVKIQNDVINDCLENTENVVKHRQMLKEIRQEAGVRDDMDSAPRTINIQSIQSIIAQNAGIEIKKDE